MREMSPPFSYGVLKFLAGSVSWAPLTDTQSSLGHYFLQTFLGGPFNWFYFAFFLALGLFVATGSCVTEITHCSKRVTIFANY